MLLIEKSAPQYAGQFFELETKMENMEQRSLETATKSEDKDSMKEMSRSIPKERKAAATGFKEDSDENEVKARLQETIRAAKMEDMEIHNWLSRCSNDTCFHRIPKWKNQGQICKSSMIATTTAEWKSEENTTSYGRPGKFPMEEIGVRQICSEQQNRELHCTNSVGSRKKVWLWWADK